ncbi:MAG: PIN domain-like protein, partial [Olpidium bornovanus]
MGCALSVSRNAFCFCQSRAVVRVAGGGVPACGGSRDKKWDAPSHAAPVFPPAPARPSQPKTGELRPPARPPAPTRARTRTLTLMGISGLLPFLKRAQRPFHIRELAGCVVAVDAYVWLHKAVSAYVDYCLNNVRMLLHHGVTPLLVFDGAPLPAKRATEAVRELCVERASAWLKENREAGEACVRNGDSLAVAADLFRRSIDVTPALASHVIRELKLWNVDYIVAPYEADAQLAYLAKQGHVAAVITEDSDLLVFGCDRVIFKLDCHGHGVEISQEGIASVLKGFRLEGFRQMCILSGCDYLSSVRNVGLATARKYVKESSNVEQIIRRMRDEGKAVRKEYRLLFAQAELTFQYQHVYDPQSKKVVSLNPLPDDCNLTAWETDRDRTVRSNNEIAFRTGIGECPSFFRGHFAPTFFTLAADHVCIATGRLQAETGLAVFEKVKQTSVQTNTIDNYFKVAAPSLAIPKEVNNPLASSVVEDTAAQDPVPPMCVTASRQAETAAATHAEPCRPALGDTATPTAERKGGAT